MFLAVTLSGIGGVFLVIAVLFITSIVILISSAKNPRPKITKKDFWKCEWVDQQKLWVNSRNPLTALGLTILITIIICTQKDGFFGNVVQSWWFVSLFLAAVCGSLLLNLKGGAKWYILLLAITFVGVVATWNMIVPDKLKEIVKDGVGTSNEDSVETELRKLREEVAKIKSAPYSTPTASTPPPPAAAQKPEPPKSFGWFKVMAPTGPKTADGKLSLTVEIPSDHRHVRRPDGTFAPELEKPEWCGMYYFAFKVVDPEDVELVRVVPDGNLKKAFPLNSAVRHGNYDQFYSTGKPVRIIAGYIRKGLPLNELPPEEAEFLAKVRNGSE